MYLNILYIFGIEFWICWYFNVIILLKKIKNYEKMAVIDRFWGIDDYKRSITNGLKVIGIGKLFYKKRERDGE